MQIQFQFQPHLLSDDVKITFRSAIYSPRVEKDEAGATNITYQERWAEVCFGQDNVIFIFHYFANGDQITLFASVSSNMCMEEIDLLTRLVKAGISFTVSKED